MELTDRMYADLIDSLRYSRDAAEKRACDAERRAAMAEARLNEIYTKILPVVPQGGAIAEREGD